MTLLVLEFDKKHMQAVVNLLNEEYRSSYEFIPYNEERALSQIQRRDLKIRLATEDGNVVGLVATHLEERAEEDIRWLAAREGPNQRLIKNTLVDEVERNANGDTVSTGVDEGSPRIKEWIERGYTLNPGWLRMSTKLEGLKPVPQAAEGIMLRSLRADEETKLVEAMNTGFAWKRLEPGILQRWKSEDPPFNQDWVQIAEAGNRIVSAVVAKPDTDYNKYLHLRRGYLGPASTLPEFRNKHLASTLTIRAMNFLYQKGMDSVRLGTSEENVSSNTLLRHLGFQVDSTKKILRKNLKNA